MNKKEEIIKDLQDKILKTDNELMRRAFEVKINVLKGNKTVCK